MHVFVVGTSHSVASAGVRERMHVDLDELYRGLQRLTNGAGILDEAVPLATCARLELYGITGDLSRTLRALPTLLARRTDLSIGEVKDHSYVHKDEDAVRHLFRVAAGLDSVIHGEAQVLGQVRDALTHPATTTTVGPWLTRLFQHALLTGKRVRSETEIGRGAASLAGAALTLIADEVESLDSRTALILGCGETGTLMARLLRKAGIGRLVVVNRTEERAGELAAELGAGVAALAALPELLADADIVVGAVANAPGLVSREALSSVTDGTSPRARYFVDLAHPRNFDSALADAPGARVFDLEDVFVRAGAARDARSTQIPLAEAIIDEETGCFLRWLRSRESVKVLRAVRSQVLERAMAEADKHAQGLNEEEAERTRALARSVARTLLHGPTLVLRDADPATSEGRWLLESAASLFGVQSADD